MVLGAGAMAESCVRLLVKKGARSIFVSNRSFDRALDLATRGGGEAVCFGYSLFEMRDVDVVIAATSSAETLLTRDDVRQFNEIAASSPAASHRSVRAAQHRSGRTRARACRSI